MSFQVTFFNFSYILYNFIIFFFFLFQVNLTVDCSGWGSEPGNVEEPLPPPAPPPRMPRPSIRPSNFLLDRYTRDSISSASGLGLEPAMQAIFAFSHILRPAHSKDSLHSATSSDGRHSPSSKKFYSFFTCSCVIKSSEYIYFFLLDFHRSIGLLY